VCPCGIYNVFKLCILLGIQPRIRIDATEPIKPSNFTGEPQVVSRYAREMMGHFPETDAINSILDNKLPPSTTKKSHSASKTPKLPKDLTSRKKGKVYNI